MKSTIFVLPALLCVLASAAAAQSVVQILAAIPKCATPCTVASVASAGCSLTNVQALQDCTCTNLTLIASLSECVQSSCDWSDQSTAGEFLMEFCSSYPKQSRQHEVRVTAISCLALALLFVGARCLARFVITSRLWWDDWTTVLATFCLIPICVAFITAANLGFGLHVWDISPAGVGTILELFFATQILYIAIQVSAKVSILILYGRIFSTTRWLRITVWYAVTALVLHGLIFVGLVVFQCNPVSSVWDRSLSRTCIDITAVGWAGAAFSIFEDIVILVLPIPEVLKLQLAPPRKIAICLMFGVGCFACVTSMLRLKAMLGFGNSFDATWDNVDVVIYSIMELAVAVICASLPALRPILVKIPGFMMTNSQVTDNTPKRKSYASPSASAALSVDHSKVGRDGFTKLPDQNGTFTSFELATLEKRQPSN